MGILLQPTLTGSEMWEALFQNQAGKGGRGRLRPKLLGGRSAPACLGQNKLSQRTLLSPTDLVPSNKQVVRLIGFSGAYKSHPSPNLYFPSLTFSFSKYNGVKSGLWLVKIRANIYWCGRTQVPRNRGYPRVWILHGRYNQGSNMLSFALYKDLLTTEGGTDCRGAREEAKNNRVWN